MPQPTFGGTNFPTFGGLALPNGQGTLSNINLNDGTNWFLQDIVIDYYNRSLGIQQQVTRAKAVYTSDDFLNKVVTLPMKYVETNNALGVALAQLSQAGEQRLSFDGTTYILAKYRGVRSPSTYPKLIRRFAPLWWELQLEFLCREPWFKDISSTTSATTTVAAAPSSPPTTTPLAGGSLAVGTYTLQYTYVWAGGETAPSPATISVGMIEPAGALHVGPSVSRRPVSRGGGVTNIAPMTRMVPGGRTIVRDTQPAASSVTLTSGTQQISVGAVTFPSWATAVKWYFTGSSPTTGFTVSNANGNAFTLNTAGNGTLPPTSTPATTFNVTYAGSVFTEPQWTITIPSSNPNNVASLALSNTTSSETLTIIPPGNILGGRLTTLTIDSSAWTVADQNGNQYDYTGSFPMLYGPAGQVNAMSLAVTSTPSDATGITVATTYANRWEGI